MLIKQKAYNITLKKAISLVVAIAFLANDLAFALPEKLYQDNSTLAVPSRLSDAAFREEFLAGRFLLTDPQVNLYIKEQILREQEILKNNWENERVSDLDVSKYASANGVVRNSVAGLSKIKLVKVTGLLARTGQFAHVGLTGRDYGGVPVMYVDSSFCNWENDALRKHETEEILQWEDLRVNILNIADKVSMQAWMAENMDNLSSGTRAKLSGSAFATCNSVREIARDIHRRSHSVDKLYDFKKKQIGEAGLRAAFDLEKISSLFNYHSDDPDEEKKLNIAAEGSNDAAVEIPVVTLQEDPVFVRKGLVEVGKDAENIINESGHAVVWRDDEFPPSGPMIESFVKASVFMNQLVNKHWQSLAEFKRDMKQIHSLVIEYKKGILRWYHIFNLWGETFGRLRRAIYFKELFKAMEVHSSAEKAVELAVSSFYRVFKYQAQIDGNTRLAALIANLVLLRNGLKPFILNKNNAAEYYRLTQDIRYGNFERFFRGRIRALLYPDQSRGVITASSGSEDALSVGRPLGMNRAWDWIIDNFNLGPFASRALAFNAGAMEELWYSFFIVSGGALLLEKICGVPPTLSVAICSLISYRVFRRDHSNWVRYFDGIEILKRRPSEEDSQELANLNLALRVIYGAMFASGGYGIVFPLIAVSAFHAAYNLLRTFFPGALGMSAGQADIATAQKTAVETMTRNKTAALAGSPAALLRHMAGYRMNDGNFVLDPAAQIMDEDHPAKVTDLANVIYGNGDRHTVYKRLKLLKQSGVNLVMGGWEKGYYLPKWITGANIEDVIARCPGLKKSSHTSDDIAAMGGQIAAYKARFGYGGSASQAAESYERNTIKRRLIRMADQDALRGLTVARAAEKLNVSFANLYKYLHEDPEAIAKYGIVFVKKYNWRTKEEAIGNVMNALGRFRRDIIRHYKFRNMLSESGLAALRRDIYDISQAHFVIWGLSNIITDKNFFGYSHINTLMTIFPDIGLDPLGFQMRWRTPKERIASIRYAIAREMPDLISSYDSLDAKDPDPAQLKNVQDGFYNIGAYDFLEWGVVRPFVRSVAPEFEGSYITMLCRVFPKARLDPLGFKLDWSTREKAIDSLEFVFSEKVPSIMDRYRRIDKLPEGELTQLRADILSIDAGHFIAWGIGRAITTKKTKHFNGSHVDALIAVFSDPRLNINRESFKQFRRENVGYQYKWENSTLEEGMDSVRNAIFKNRPDIIERYDRLEELEGEGIKLLKRDICEITHGLFMVWGIGKAFKQKYFNYSYKDALIAAFPKLGLNRLDFGSEWTSPERRLESVRYAIVKRLRERRPDLMAKYLAKEALDPEAAEDLRREVYRIRNGSFRTLGLSAAMTRDISPEFEGSYINAIIKSFPDLGLDPLGFQLDWSTIDRANASIRYIILREVPVIKQLYENIEKLDDDELDRLRNEIVKITFAHFSVWGLTEPMHKGKRDYYDTSYVTALIKAFDHKRLNLTASNFIDHIPRLQSEMAGRAAKIPDYLIAEYLPIMESVSKKYSKYTKSDPRSYLSGAYEGFCEAYVKYTPSHPRFRSLAIRGIRFGVKHQVTAENSLSGRDRQGLQMMHEAEMELMENGVSRPSVEDIARVTGMTKATVEKLYSKKGTISLQTPYEREGTETGPESTIEGSIGQIDSNKEVMERDDMVGAISREMEAAITRKWPKSADRYLEIYRRIVFPAISMNTPDTFDSVAKTLNCSHQNIQHFYATSMIPLLRQVLHRLGITKEDLLKKEDEYIGNKRLKERYSLDHPDAVDSISARKGAKDDEEDEPEAWEMDAEAESEDDLPVGRPAQLLGEMREGGVFGKAKARTSLELSGNAARGGEADSRQTIYRELKVLRRLGLVIKSGTSYYLARWLEDFTDSKWTELTADLGLNKASPKNSDLRQTRTLIARLKTGKSQSVQAPKPENFTGKNAGRLLKTLRKKAGLTQAEATLAAGVSQATLSNAERGIATASNLNLIAHALTAKKSEESSLVRNGSLPTVDSISNRKDPGDNLDAAAAWETAAGMSRNSTPNKTPLIVKKDKAPRAYHYSGYKNALRRAIVKGDKDLLDMTKKAYAKITEAARLLEASFDQILDGKVTAENLKIAHEAMNEVMIAVNSITDKLPAMHPLKDFLADSFGQIELGLESIRVLADRKSINDDSVRMARNIVKEYRSLIKALAIVAGENLDAAAAWEMAAQGSASDETSLWRRRKDARMPAISSIFRDWMDHDDKLSRLENLGIDTRPLKSGLMEGWFVGLDMAVKDLLNPNNKPIKVAYGASAGNISSVLLSTNASVVAMIDHGPFEPNSDGRGGYDFLPPSEYMSGIAKRGFTHMETLGNSYSYSNLSCLIAELSCIGVSKEQIENIKKDYAAIKHGKTDTRNMVEERLPSRRHAYRINFDWAYPGEASKPRQVIFAPWQVTDAKYWAEDLKSLMGGELDGYYQKAGQGLVKAYGSYLPYIASMIGRNGFIATDDVDDDMSFSEYTDYSEEKMKCLTGMGFEPVYPSEEMAAWSIEIRTNPMAQQVWKSGYGWEVGIIRRISTPGIDTVAADEPISSGATSSMVTAPGEVAPNETDPVTETISGEVFEMETTVENPGGEFKNSGIHVLPANRLYWFIDNISIAFNIDVSLQNLRTGEKRKIRDGRDALILEMCDQEKIKIILEGAYSKELLKGVADLIARFLQDPVVLETLSRGKEYEYYENKIKELEQSQNVRSDPGSTTLVRASPVVANETEAVYDTATREEPMQGIVSAVGLMDNVLLPAFDEGRAYEVRYDRNRLRSSGDGAIEAFDKYIECVERRVQAGNPGSVVKVIDRPGVLFSVAAYANIEKSKKIGEARVDIPGELKDMPVDIVNMLNIAFEASNIPQGSDISSCSRLAEFIKASGAQLIPGPVWNIILPRSVPVTGKIREHYEIMIKQLKQYA